MSVGDRLLYALSARSELGWSSIKRIFDSLYEADGVVTDVTPLRYRRADVVRTLDSLGHVEFYPRQGQVKAVVACPAIALLPGRGLPTAVVVGARSPSSVEQLRVTAKQRGVILKVQSQVCDPRLHPSRISLIADDLEQLLALSEMQGLHCANSPVAWSILQATASLDDYLTTLVPEHLGGINWEREDFDPDALYFKRYRREDGTLLSRYTHATRRTRLHIFYRDGVGSVIDPDWGRFALLHAVSRNVLSYDAELFRFAVPVTIPLPKLFARALCLCSGLVPAVENQTPLQQTHGIMARVYDRVPLHIAKLVAEKLGQGLEFRLCGDNPLRRTKRG
jgi:hypothetical protein